MMSTDEKRTQITAIDRIKQLIGDNDEVNLEWLKTVTQLSAAVISKIVIQELGMVVLDGRIYSKEKAERRLEQLQTTAQSEIDKETFRKGPVEIDMMTLREKLWTANFPDRVLGQERHQFCPIWSFLEGQASSIILRYDWITRFENSVKEKEFSKVTTYQLVELINEMGIDFRTKGKVIFAKSKPRNSIFGKEKEIWVMFLITQSEGGIKVEGLDMVNVLTLSTVFKSRERAYKALNEYIELINYLVSDPSIFKEVIIGQ